DAPRSGATEAVLSEGQQTWGRGCPPLEGGRGVPPHRDCRPIFLDGTVCERREDGVAEAQGRAASMEQAPEKSLDACRPIDVLCGWDDRHLEPGTREHRCRALEGVRRTPGNFVPGDGSRIRQGDQVEAAVGARPEDGASVT